MGNSGRRAGPLPNTSALATALELPPVPPAPRALNRLYICNRPFISALCLSTESPTAAARFTRLDLDAARQVAARAAHIISAIRYNDVAGIVGEALGIRLQAAHDAHVTFAEPHSAVLIAKYFRPPASPRYSADAPDDGRLEFTLWEVIDA